MSKSGKRRNRYGDIGHTPPGTTFEDTISMYRPVLYSPNQLEPIKHIQDYIFEVLAKGGIRSGMSRVALDGLRMVMMPTQELYRLHHRDPELTSSAKVQRHITKLVPSIKDTVRNVKGTRGVVLSGDEGSFAALVFEDSRLVNEQRALFDAVSRPVEKVRVPTMGLVVLPRVPYDVAQKLNAGLSEVAGSVNVAVGSAMFDIRGNH